MTWVELAPVSWAMPTIQGTGEEPGCTPATGGLWFPIPGMWVWVIGKKKKKENPAEKCLMWTKQCCSTENQGWIAWPSPLQPPHDCVHAFTRICIKKIIYDTNHTYNNK